MKLIKLKCDGCGSILKANKELKKITCNYCGTEFYIDETKIKENERKIKELGYQEINNKRTLTTTLSIFGIIIISCLLIFFYYKINYIKIPMDSKKYKGENYEDIIIEFENLGFKNIETVPKNDLIKGWFTKDGEIEKISIGGDSIFEEGDIFSKNKTVVITYHTFKEQNLLTN